MVYAMLFNRYYHPLRDVIEMIDGNIIIFHAGEMYWYIPTMLA